MKQKQLIEVKKIAREAGFHDIRTIGKWKQYEVEEAIFTDNNIHYIGYPQYILVSSKEIRWTKDYKESLAIMKAFLK